MKSLVRIKRTREDVVPPEGLLLADPRFGKILYRLVNVSENEAIVTTSKRAKQLHSIHYQAELLDDYNLGSADRPIIESMYFYYQPEPKHTLLEIDPGVPVFSTALDPLPSSDSQCTLDDYSLDSNAEDYYTNDYPEGDCWSD